MVVGYDPELSLPQLAEATRRLRQGAMLIGTNADAVLPTPDDFIPECGPVLAFLETASGQRATVVGKPPGCRKRTSADGRSSGAWTCNGLAAFGNPHVLLGPLPRPGKPPAVDGSLRNNPRYGSHHRVTFEGLLRVGPNL